MPQPKQEPGYTRPDVGLLNAEHVKRYRETDGRVGHEWNGATCLLLTTTGRASGLPRETPLIYAPDGDAYIVVASKGGAPEHPNWYLNLMASQDATVQVKADRFPAVGREAVGEEYQRAWDLAAARWPNYNVYTQRTDRRIPVVILARRPGREVREEQGAVTSWTA